MAVKQLTTQTSWYDDQSFTSNVYSEFNKHNEKEYYANTVINEATGKWSEYCHLIKHPQFQEDWLKSGANKFYQLFQGIKPKNDKQQIKGTNTIF